MSRLAFECEFEGVDSEGGAVEFCLVAAACKMHLECRVDIVEAACIYKVNLAACAFFSRSTDINDSAVEVLLELSKYVSRTECASCNPVMAASVTRLVLVWAVARKCIVFSEECNLWGAGADFTAECCIEAAVWILHSEAALFHFSYEELGGVIFFVAHFRVTEDFITYVIVKFNVFFCKSKSLIL